MTNENQNNAAQPGLTDDEILDAIKAGVRAARDEGLACAGPDNYVVAGALALLSKLRAPVADERAAFEAAWRELNSPWPMNSRMHDDGRYATPDIEREWRLWQARAALASAPADERAALHHVANEWADMATCAIQWIRNIKNGVSTPEAALENLMSNLTHCQEVQSCAGVRPSRENAPVAGEATYYAVMHGQALFGVFETETAANECIAKSLHPGVMSIRPLYAAPQASEAVRIVFPTHLRKMWSGGDVQAWLDEHQGVTAPKPSAKGSLERYRKWQAERDEAFGSGVKAAADLVKKMVDDYDAAQGSTDPETGTREYPGEGATWVCEMQELEESIRALSAQPGAQRTGGSDAN